MGMPIPGDWMLALVYVGGGLCVGFYLFIKHAEEFTGSVRVMAIICRMSVVIILRQD
jgi:hypothetical protein